MKESECNFCKINSNGFCFTDVIHGDTREYYTIEENAEYIELGTIFRLFYDMRFSEIKTFVFCSGVVDFNKFEEKLKEEINIDFYELIAPPPDVHNAYGPAIIEYLKSGKIREERWWYNDFEYTKNVNEWFQSNGFKTWKDMKEEDFNRMWLEIL